MVETLQDKPTARPPRLKKWQKYTTASALTLLVATGGTGWYFSSEVLRVDHSPPDFSMTVVEVTDTQVTLPTDESTLRDGIWGLQWDDGRAIIGDVVKSNDQHVVREIDKVLYGELDAGTQTRIETWAYGENPRQAHGIDYETVDVKAELGNFPAWFVPGEGDTWVIAVHGRNASAAESLRALPTYRDAGYPLLAVTHRNDVGAPASPDGYHHLGDSEWHEIEAAVDYAEANGAKHVVLHGWSMGGAVAMMALRRMDRPERVSGIIMDSPVLDWNSTLDKQASQRWLPGPVTDMAKGLAEWRAEMDLDELDQRSFAADMTTPVLLFADTADETVEVSATLEFADKVPQELLTLVETKTGHTASWNEDPRRYATELGKFLGDL